MAAKPPGNAASESTVALLKYVFATVKGPGAAGEPEAVLPMVPASIATVATPIPWVVPSVVVTVFVVAPEPVALPAVRLIV